MICDNRFEFIDKFIDEINGLNSSFYYFIGNNGSGKKFVLRNIEEKLKSKYIIFNVIDNCLVRKDKPIIVGNLNYSFNFSALVGFSIAYQKEQDKIIQYIISNLKFLSIKKAILISISDYEKSSSESRLLIDVIINNLDFISSQIKKRIVVIATCEKYNFYDFSHTQPTKVTFNNYTRDDLKVYLTSTLNYPTAQVNVNNIDTLFRLCGGNFDLVNAYSQYILNNPSNTSIKSIIDMKLGFYVNDGKQYNIPSETLEYILFLSSHSVKTLTKNLITTLDDLSSEHVHIAFLCAEKICFLGSVKHENFNESSNYFFISKEEKEYLQLNYSEFKLDIKYRYYTYISNCIEDEYLERAELLHQCSSTYNNEAFVLLCLGLSKSFMLKDSVLKSQIDSFFDNTFSGDIALSNLYTDIKNAYKLHYEYKLVESSQIIINLLQDINNAALEAELLRMLFKNINLGNLTNTRKISTVVFELINLINIGIRITKTLETEKILTLRIIYDISPYLLDSQNNKEEFLNLYDKSLRIVDKIHKNFNNCNYAEYILNIFNRKAFLYTSAKDSIVFYERAEYFFKENKVFDELAITKACKAGMYLHLREYELAKIELNKALNIIDTNEINIHQSEKIYNNLYLVAFLLEEEKSIVSIDYLQSTISKLEALLPEKPSALKHVLFLNIASFSLYGELEDKYLSTKQKLELSLNCDDVSDINNVRINDFYRYHFAWFEFYRVIMSENWDEANLILDKLSGFYPSIFYNTKEMDLRIEAGKTICAKKLKLSARDFCLDFLTYASSNTNNNIYSRGLLISDLQFTSWE